MAEPSFDAKVMKGMVKVLKKFKDNLTKKEKQHLARFSYKSINKTMYILLTHQIQNSSWSYLSNKIIFQNLSFYISKVTSKRT